MAHVTVTDRLTVRVYIAGGCNTVGPALLSLSLASAGLGLVEALQTRLGLLLITTRLEITPRGRQTSADLQSSEADQTRSKQATVISVPCFLFR